MKGTSLSQGENFKERLHYLRQIFFVFSSREFKMSGDLPGALHMCTLGDAVGNVLAMSLSTESNRFYPGMVHTSVASTVVFIRWWVGKGIGRGGRRASLLPATRVFIL